jgi:hypothetical protein
MDPRRDMSIAGAAITARDLIGGIVIAVALGSLVDALPLPLVPRRAIDVVAALSVTLAAGWLWGKAMNAGVTALVMFLAVDLLMYALGWRVGAPNAARRAAMLAVTILSASAAAVAAGAAIGAMFRPSATPSVASVSGA